MRSLYGAGRHGPSLEVSAETSVWSSPQPAVPPSPAISAGLAFTLTRHFSNLAGLMENAPAYGPSCSVIFHHRGRGVGGSHLLVQGQAMALTLPPTAPESKVRKITLHNSLFKLHS